MDSRKTAAVGFLPLFVIALIFGSYLSIVLQNNFASSSTNSSCNTYFNYDSPNPISALVISSGFTGRICVEYSNPLNNSVSFSSYISALKYNSSGIYGVCGDCELNMVNDLQLSASPNGVNFEPSQNPNNETEMVTYTISVPSNATYGIYGVFLLQFCTLFPIIVVPDNLSLSHVRSSDFSSWYPHSGSCPVQVITAELLGVSGFEVLPAT